MHLKLFQPGTALAVACALAAQATTLLAAPAAAAHPLAYVPQDTAYVYAQVTPFTKQQWPVISTPSVSFSLLHAGYQLGELIYFLDASVAEDAAATAEAHAGQTADEAAEADANAASTLLEQWQASSVRSVLVALRDELDQVRTLEDVARLGLKPNGVFAFYGVDLVPVLRAEAGGLTELEQLMQRLETAYGSPFEQLGSATEPLWAIEWGDVHVLVGRLDQHVVLSVVPSALDPEVWRQRLLERPRKALGESGLARFNRTEGFLPLGSGYVDNVRLVEQLSQPGELLSEFAAAWFGGLQQQSPECQQETLELMHTMPRMIAGATRLDRRAVEMRFALELRQDLAAELASVAARAPDLHGAQTSLSMSMAMAPGPMIEFLRRRAAAVAADPWQCTELAAMNTSFASLGQSMASANAAMSFGFQGVSFAADRVHLDEEELYPSSADLSVAIHTTQPAMMLGMLQLGLPQLAGVGVQADGVPTKLALEGIPEQLGEVHGLHAERVLAVATGADSAARLQAIAAQELEGAGPLLSLRMGSDGLQWLRQLMELDPAIATQPQAQRERTRAYNRVIFAGLDGVELRLSITPAGIELHQLVRLIQP